MFELFETLGFNTFELIITSFVGYVFWKLKKLDDKKDKYNEQAKQDELKKEERRNNKDNLLLGLARVSLINKMQESLDRGFTTQADYEVVEALYESYRKLGGNGVVEHLFEHRYNTLRVKEHE